MRPAALLSKSGHSNQQALLNLDHAMMLVLAFKTPEKSYCQG